MAVAAWSVAIQALCAVGGSIRVLEVERLGLSLDRAQELGLCKRTKGRWVITPRGVDWCMHRLRVDVGHHGGGVHFVATWFGGALPSGMEGTRRLAVVVEPIRKGQTYRLASGRFVRVLSANGANIACVYLEGGAVGMRRDFFSKSARRV